MNDETRLPVWARDLLANLRATIDRQDRQIIMHERRIAEQAQVIRDMQADNGPADSNVFIDREDPETLEEIEPLGLGTGQIRFELEQGKRTIYAGIDTASGWFEVHSLGGRMRVEPISPGTIYITIGD